MRLAPIGLAAIVGLAGCWGGAAAPAPVEPEAPVVATPPGASCHDAALGIDRATRELRGPDVVPVVGRLKSRCAADHWPAAALDCFHDMIPGDLGRCAGELGDKQRRTLFAVLRGALGNDRAELAIAIARLQNISLGIPECDDFVASVGRILECEEMELSTRVSLGTQTVDLWSLPDAVKLPADAIKRMAAVCAQSRGQLEQQAAGAGCKL